MAKGGVITGEFKDARYAKGKIAYYPPKSEDFWKNREMRLATAKGVSGKWSHREKAYIMSKGQAETLKKYLKEGKDANFISGEVYDNDGYMEDGGLTSANKYKAKVIHNENRFEYYENDNLISPTSSQKFYWDMFGFPKGVERKEELFVTEIDEISGKTKKEVYSIYENNLKEGKYQYIDNIKELFLVFDKKMSDGGYMADGGEFPNRYLELEYINSAISSLEQQIESDYRSQEIDIYTEKCEVELEDLKSRKETLLIGRDEYANGGKFSDGGYMADGGGVDEVNTEVTTIKKNIMGTTDIIMKIKGMRKPQDFTVYPISADQAGKPIMIQSDTRIGYLDLKSGKGLMSQSHSNGAYSYHYALDKKVPFIISETDLQRIKNHIANTSGSKVGSSVIFSDNSGAGMMAKGGRIKESDIKVGEVFTLKNGEQIKIVTLFQEKYGASDKDWVEYTRNGKTYANSVNELKIFINNWKM